jgi:integrase
VLRWSAIDLNRNMFSIIDDSRAVPGTRTTHRTTKNSKSRSIPIHPDLRKVLECLRHRSEAGFVFRAMRGGPLHSRNVLQAFIDGVIEPLKARFPSEDGDGGFATGRLRSMRHYFCSWCANSGVPETVLMRWLGHASSMMVRRYYHLHDEEAQMQMKKLGKLRGLDAP